jgi:hypothetical protein
MISPEIWVQRCDAVLAAGGLNSREREFVVGVRHRKAWSVAKRRRPKFVLTPEMYAEIEGRVLRQGEGERR